MLSCVICSPCLMPNEVPIGCPNCNTNSPPGMSFVAKRCPGGTAARTSMDESSGSSSSKPGDVSFFTTATLSFGSTMMANSLNDDGVCTLDIMISILFFVLCSLCFVLCALLEVDTKYQVQSTKH